MQKLIDIAWGIGQHKLQSELTLRVANALSCVSPLNSPLSLPQLPEESLRCVCNSKLRKRIRVQILVKLVLLKPRALGMCN